MTAKNHQWPFVPDSGECGWNLAISAGFRQIWPDFGECGKNLAISAGFRQIWPDFGECGKNLAISAGFRPTGQNLAQNS
jgi:hypothetical protein